MSEGRIRLCATPIGNLEDITLRVLRTLREADAIACEDTRRTAKLLAHYDIQKPLFALHQHNWRTQGPRLLESARDGENIAVVSDAGMPGISDPGAELVTLAIEAGVAVEVLPGASAGLTALVLSGLPCDRFVFEGFLPRETKPRRERLDVLRAETRSMVFYESPQRVEKTLEDLRQAFGSERRAAWARELTKLHEEVVRGTLETLAERAQQGARGECVLIVEGRAPESPASADKAQAREWLRECIAAGMSRKEAIATLISRHGVARNVAYRLSLEFLDKE